MSLSLPTEPCKVLLASVNPRQEPRPVVLGQPLTSFSTAPCATNRETGLERERDLLKPQNPCSVFQSDRDLTQQRLSPRPQPRSSPGRHCVYASCLPSWIQCNRRTPDYHLSLPLQWTTAVPDSVLSWCHQEPPESVLIPTR